MALAIFDLDNTLIGGDSDVLWGRYLGQHGLVDVTAMERQQERFYQDYLSGSLDIDEFLRFQLHILSQHDTETLASWQQAYVEEQIKPILLPQADELLNKHRAAGDTLMIITATNRFLTQPIAELLGIDLLIATEPEFLDGRYTGRVEGIPSFAEGKVARLRQWLSDNREDLEGSWFYSDSHNDLPLLNLVEHAVAVDPDEKLAEAARRNGWPIMSLR